MGLKVVMMSTPESSNIDAIGYVKESRQMFVRFRSGKTYVYHGVPVTVFADMRSAQSKGAFLAKYVKGQFKANSVERSKDVAFRDAHDSSGEFVTPKLLLRGEVDLRWRW